MITFPAVPTFPASETFPASITLPTPVFPGPAFFIVEGDSLSTTNLGIVSWPDKLLLQSSFLDKGPLTNLAASGDTAANIATAFDGTVAPCVSASLANKDGYFFLLAGTNDISGSRTAAQILTDLQTSWTAAVALGLHVVAFTVPASSSFSAPMNAERATLNAAIAIDPLVDTVADADTWFPNPADATYFYDGTHLTEAGTLLMAQNVAALLTP